jgi:hypothetical protein
VLDVGLLLGGISSRRDRLKKLRQTIHEHPYLSDPADMKKQLDTVYVIPTLEPVPRTIRNFVVALVRKRVLHAVHSLIYVQEEDNRHLQMNSAL